MSKEQLICLHLKKGACPQRLLQRLLEEPSIHVDLRFGIQPIDPASDVYAVRVSSDEAQPGFKAYSDVESIEIFPDEEIEPETR